MKLYLFSSTHWDREWYKSFQGFRFMLVRLIDDLIEGLETIEDYGVFHFDGQTIVLEDYLEIAPENRARLEALIRKGKLRVGPWYNMPDEFNCSGESMIKNLRRGHEIAHAFGGEPMQLGYICDIFGHTAQMPQIFSQFGIHHIALGRGTNEIDTPTHFIWQSPDGTEAFGWKLNDPYGYGTLSCNACGGDPMTDENYRNHLKSVLDREIGRSDIPIVLLTDGQDHIPMRRNSSRYLELIRELYPGLETFQVAIEEAWAEIESYKDQMPTKYGELNETSRNYGGLITNTLSSRYDLKRANDILESRLEMLISPALAMGLVNCRDGFLRHAETFLLRCHPHDSICGCSVPQVHKDMHYRFDQCNCICDEIQEELQRNLVHGVIGGNGSASTDGSLICRVYNPLPYRRDGVQTITVDFPADFPHKYAEPFGYEEIFCFRLYDRDGIELPYGIIKAENKGEIITYTLRVPLTLNPMGVTEVFVKAFPERTRQIGRLASGARYVDNGLIRVDVNPDGTLNVTDRRTGRKYENVLTLLDDADIGDGWYHCNPMNTETVTNTSAVVSVIENNQNAVTLRIAVTMNVPVQIERSNTGLYRSVDRVDLTVTHTVTVLRDSDHISVKSIVNNTAKDHRLKLRIPTGIIKDTYTASMQFCFVTRKTGVNPESATCLEFGVAEKQNNGVVYKADQNGGLAFLSKYGFHECAVYENGDMDMTMMRCFGKTPAGQKIEGQLLGTWDFEYELVLFTEETPDARLRRERDCLVAPVICVTLPGQRAGAGWSMAALEGDTLAFSTADRYDGKRCVRVYNPTALPVNEVLFIRDMKKASLVQLDGRVRSALDVKDNRVSLSLRPYEICTVAVEE